MASILPGARGSDRRTVARRQPIRRQPRIDGRRVSRLSCAGRPQHRRRMVLMRWGMPPPLRTGVPPVTPPAPAVGQNTGSFRAAPVSSRACKNIPLYRNSEMTYVSPIPAHQEGRSCVVTVASRACGGRGSVGRERSGAGRIALREPKTSCRMSGAARLRLVCKFPAPSTGLEKLRRNGGPCVRQNRVVLAVVATVKCFANAAVASTGALPVTFARTREARGNSAPGRARHKPSNHCAGKAE